MLQWLEAHKDLADWVAALLTVIAIAVALMQPELRSKRARLNMLIGYRNLAWIAHRFLVFTLREASLGSWHPKDSLDYPTCIKALDAIKFEDVSPSYLISEFVEIWHMTRRGENYMSQQTACPEELAETMARSCSAMQKVDAFLRDRGVQFDQLSFARPVRTWSVRAT